MKWKHLICTAMMCAVCISQASALEYTVAAPEDYLFATPTSQDVIYEREEVNVDRSKDVALVAPGFGSPTSYLPGSGEYLTPQPCTGRALRRAGQRGGQQQLYRRQRRRISRR